jgi:hypothetical protein
MNPERTVELFDATPSNRLKDYAVGATLSLIGGLALMAAADQWASYGWAFVVLIPFAVGLIFGYATDVDRGLHVFAVIFLMLGLLGGVLVAGLAGVVCGVIASVLALVPTAIGVGVGAWLRRSTRSRVSRASVTLSSLLVVLATGTLVYGESLLGAPAVEEEVATARILDMEPTAAWELLMFYEEVDVEPPLYARIGLPHPLRTEGEMRAVGDVVRCVYSKGQLRKRITVFEPGRRLAFDVIEQTGVEDRSAELRRGSFDFETLGDGRTRVTLTTVYRPLLAARPAWRPFEQRLAHVLHEHVLDGMEVADRDRRSSHIASSSP